MITAALRDETADMRELALDELDQVTGGAGTAGGPGAGPAASAVIVATAVAAIGAVAGIVLGHAIKGDE